MGQKLWETLALQFPGPKSKLDDGKLANLLQVLRGPAPHRGLWNGPEAERLRLRAKSLIILAVLIGEPISRQQGWEYLKQMRLRLRVPRPEHQEVDSKEHSCLEKKLQQEVERIQAEHPDADVEVWSGAGDAPPPVKMSIGLGCTRLSDACGWNKENNPSLQSIGSGNGCGYMPLFNLRLDKLTGGFSSGVAFAESSAKAFPRPYVNTKLFSRVLKDFADHFGVGQTKRIVYP